MKNLPHNKTAKCVLAEERGMTTMVAAPGGLEWWVENPFGFSTEFRAYVDGLAKSASVAKEEK